MLLPLLGISLFKPCTSYLRKHVTSSITDSEFVFLNGTLILFFAFLYANFYKKETLFEKEIKLTYLQIACLIAGSCITSLSLIKLVEYERKHSSVQTYLLLKSFSIVLFIFIGYMFFNESFTINQIVGFSLIIAGIIVSSIKSPP